MSAPAVQLTDYDELVREVKAVNDALVRKHGAELVGVASTLFVVARMLNAQDPGGVQSATYRNNLGVLLGAWCNVNGIEGARYSAALADVCKADETVNELVSLSRNDEIIKRREVAKLAPPPAESVIVKPSGFDMLLVRLVNWYFSKR